MKQFLTKPVVVGAFQFGASPDALHMRECVQTIRDGGGSAFHRFSDAKPDKTVLYVHAPEGVQEAKPGDWIVNVARGVFRALSPEDFEKAYEPAPETGPSQVPTKTVSKKERKGKASPSEPAPPVSDAPPASDVPPAETPASESSLA